MGGDVGAETLLIIRLAQLAAHVARSSVRAVIAGVGGVNTCVTFILRKNAQCITKKGTSCLHTKAMMFSKPSTLEGIFQRLWIQALQHHCHGNEKGKRS